MRIVCASAPRLGVLLAVNGLVRNFAVECLLRQIEVLRLWRRHLALLITLVE